MKANRLNYEQIKFIVNSITEEKNNTSVTLRRLKQLGNTILNAFVSSDQPKISTYKNQRGETYWKIYDPLSSRSIYCGSEQEVRIWLDRRYHQS